MARILLCEDDDAVRLFVARALQMDAHEVVLAEDGEEGFDLLREHDGAFDLVLTDIKMPLMDGIALAENASAFYPTLPILMMTGFADQRERADHLAEIVIDVIAKPFSLAEIRAAVRGALFGDLRKAG